LTADLDGIHLTEKYTNSGSTAFFHVSPEERRRWLISDQPKYESSTLGARCGGERIAAAKIVKIRGVARLLSIKVYVQYTRYEVWGHTAATRLDMWRNM